MNVSLKVWRQDGPNSAGRLVDYPAEGISEHMSFLEMIDVVNEKLEAEGSEPIAFDHDCREGICGMCSMQINGVPHGPDRGVTTCQLHMRTFKDGDTITIEPWRATAFPVVKDLVVDRSSLDRIIQAGGYISVNTGGPRDANETPINKAKVDEAMDYAACIGCGACVASCKHASASLFTAAKLSHLSLLPQGQAERYERTLAMVAQMDMEGFGACTNQFECEAACPKEISVQAISRMNRDYIKAGLSGH